MKRIILALALLGSLATGQGAQAVIGTVDDVPAATLLLPYFEVALNDPDDVTTLFSVNNASASAALVHVVIWSDLSVPVLDFNIYLTGYDVQTVNLRDILVNGILPRTASAGQDTGEAEPNPAPTASAISNQGAFSDDVDFDSCDGQLPPPVLPASFIAHLQASLTGQFSSILGGCAGRAFGDGIARGYITMDTVNNCTLQFPGDAGYFGTAGSATNDNILWGDYFYVNPGQNFAQGETLVHVEASVSNPETSVPGEYTFYGRYVGWTAADNREPLTTNFAVRYINGGAFTGGTDLITWRDSKVNQNAFKCGTLPSWYLLGQEQIVIFDEQENPEVPQTLPVSPQPPGEALSPFGAEAQRTAVDSEDFPVSFDFGWVFLDLNTSVAAAGANPPEDPTAAQAWVTVVMDADGRFSVGFDAIQLDNATNANHSLIGNNPT